MSWWDFAFLIIGLALGFSLCLWLIDILTML